MDEINVALDQLQLSSFPSAKIKVDELFLRWLVSNEGSQTVSNLLQEIEGKHHLNSGARGDDDRTEKEEDYKVGGTLGNLKSSLGSSLNGLGGGLSFSSVSTGFNSPYGQVGAAPHSPYNDATAAAPPRSPTKKSPKKRTQSEMYTSPMAQKGGDMAGAGAADGGTRLSAQGAVTTRIGALGEIGGDAAIHAVSRSASGAAEQGQGQGRDRVGHGISGSVSIAESTDGYDAEGLAHISARRRANFDTIPKFYEPGRKNRWREVTPEGEGSSSSRGGNDTGGNSGITARAGRGAGPVRSVQQRSDDSLESRLPEILEFFNVFPDGVPQDKLVHATKRLIGLPSYFNVPIVQRILTLYGGDGGAGEGEGGRGRSGSNVLWPRKDSRVTLEAFKLFWEHEVAPYDRVERFFRVIAQPGRDYIVKDDFLPFLRELLHFHPGLDFLENHEDFQQKYALTVITRIFYEVNTSGSGRLSLREVYKSNLFSAFMHVDEQNDINRVREYFSYEHFYVLYCRFFELDTDHDLHVSADDLLRYSDYALSEVIVERVFHSAHRVFQDGQQGGLRRGGMPYPDFVYFMIAEEDKTSVQSIRYWFRCCDLDGDGVLSPEEMQYFYRYQLHRAVSWGQEPIEFGDVLCQLVDLIDPKDPRAITLADLTKPDKRQLSGILFDVLFNIQKFLKFETRDPFQEKMRREDGFITEWDRFASLEYARLADADGGGRSGGGADGGGYDGGMEVEGAGGYTGMDGGFEGNTESGYPHQSDVQGGAGVAPGALELAMYGGDEGSLNMGYTDSPVHPSQQGAYPDSDGSDSGGSSGGGGGGGGGRRGGAGSSAGSGSSGGRRSSRQNAGRRGEGRSGPRSSRGSGNGGASAGGRGNRSRK